MPRKRFKDNKPCHARLVLEDGSQWHGFSFGAKKGVAGEVVFNTGMVGYPEALTDPSYHGQILCFTYPLIGNYGVPKGDCHLLQRQSADTGKSVTVTNLRISPDKVGVDSVISDSHLSGRFESDRVHVSGLIVSDYSESPYHWDCARTLGQWLAEEDVPAIHGIDTRALTRKLRHSGTMLGKIVFDTDIEFYDPNRDDLLPKVTVEQPVLYGDGGARICLIDCGAKQNIIRCLLARGVSVLRVPHDFSVFEENEKFDGIVISNGPGDPKRAAKTIETVREALERKVPLLGICLGNQLLALAAGGDTYKLKYGHRGQNQPCVESGTERCYITSQNHGFAVRRDAMPRGFKVWFENANDDTVEGIRHKSGRFMSVQFHPEASAGPYDTEFIFDLFLKKIRRTNRER
ncbi:MAG: glutamine-hydrolyzing carbamoyl-phosphate synthase small subunit [Planctomycetota bacterium]